MNWYFDTSVLVAAAVAQHPHHTPALAILDESIGRKHRGSVSAHSLTEFYSVLTRTPFRPPLYPNEVWQIIEAMILPHMELVTLSAKEYQEVVRQCSRSGWIGGKIHDAVHLRCAQKAGFDRLYTFNVKDFRALASDEFRGRIAAP